MDYSDRLLDFMYVDREKAAALLSQILSEGFITEYETAQQSENNSIIGLSGTTGKMASFLGLDVSAEGEKEHRSHNEERIRKNPEWAQAKALVQYISDVDEQGAEVSADRLKVLSGRLEIYDLSVFRKATESSDLILSVQTIVKRNISKIVPSIAECEKQIALLRDNSSSNSQLKGPKQEIKRLEEQKKRIMEPMDDYINAAVLGICHFIAHTRFSVIAVLYTEKGPFWFSLKEHLMLHDHGDTLLKYGVKIEGNWNVAGILDAPSIDVAFNDNLEPALWMQIAEPVANLLQTSIGRSEGFATLMPLAIYRDLGAILK